MIAPEKHPVLDSLCCASLAHSQGVSIPMIEQIKGYDLVTEKLNNNIRALKLHTKILDLDKDKYLHPVFEKAMYIAISLYDLNVALKYLDVSNAVGNGFEANHFARNVALISYELVNHQQKIVGQLVADLVKERLGDEGLATIKSHSKELKSITKEHHKTLNHIRNKLIAHRTENGMDMANGMLDINQKEIFMVGKSIFDVYFKLYKAYSELLGKL